jgi:antitoxin (DNA-binding transcriptional repressor) of toxin-antitoxin stability system
VERGETVTILQRGKEKALITPVRSSPIREKVKASDAFGMWKERKDLSNVARFVRTLRQGRFGDV